MILDILKQKKDKGLFPDGIAGNVLFSTAREIHQHVNRASVRSLVMPT